MTTEKINANEILADSELEQVAGGFNDEIFDDMAQLREQCGLDLSLGDFEYSVKTLKENYASAGIDFRYNKNKANEYRDKHTRKQLSRLEALSTLIEFGHSKGRYGKGYQTYGY